jgi:hypothetical protein
MKRSMKARKKQFEAE